MNNLEHMSNEAQTKSFKHKFIIYTNDYDDIEFILNLLSKLDYDFWEGEA